MQQIINGQKTEMHLCQDCVEQTEKPLTFDQFFSGLLDFFGGMPESVSPAQNSKECICKCPRCGLSYEDFKKTGRLGCSDCYQTFQRELESVLKNIQGGNRHEGKYPQKSGVELLNRRKLSRLKLELAKAIEEEQYENAAKLRDQIRELEGSVT
jgi:protein arginine kinase activator